MPVLFVNAALISSSASFIDAAAKTVTFPSCAKTDGGLRAPNTAVRQTVRRFMWKRPILKSRYEGTETHLRCVTRHTNGLVAAVAMSDYRAGSFVCCAAGCDRPKGHISHRMLHQCWFRGRTGGMGFEIDICAARFRVAHVCTGSFTSFPPSRRVRFAPRADILAR